MRLRVMELPAQELPQRSCCDSRINDDGCKYEPSKSNG